MDDERTKVLVVGDRVGLRGAKALATVDWHHERTLKRAVERAVAIAADAVILKELHRPSPLVAQIRSAFPHTAIIVLARRPHPIEAQLVIAAGAEFYDEARKKRNTADIIKAAVLAARARMDAPPPLRLVK